MKSSFKVLIFFFSIVFLACDSGVPLEIDKQHIVAQAKGPLFSGLNTATIDFKIKEFLPVDVEISQIASARLKSLAVNPIGEGLPSVSSYTVLVASPNQEMNQIGFLNAVQEGEASLVIAKEQPFMKDILKDPSQTLVIDFDLAEDYFDNLTFELTLEWEIHVTK